MIPPFKNIDITIPNLKRAKVHKFSGGRSGFFSSLPSYVIDLESYNGTTTTIMQDSSWIRKFKEKLEFQINESIRTKTEFKYTAIQFDNLFDGVLLFFVAFIVYTRIKKNKISQ